jgi:hypothetical protein
MLFKDILNKHAPLIRHDFRRLVASAMEKQQHPGDMLLWLNNGTYDESVTKFRHPEPGETYSPYVIGTHEVGHSEHSHYRFIQQYRTTNLQESHAKYLKSLEYPGGKYSQEHSKKRDKLEEDEENSISLEMLIYLKIWESDNIIKKLYELVRLAHGESYHH